MPDTDALSAQEAKQRRRKYAAKGSSAWVPDMPAEFRSQYQLGNYPRERVERVMRKYLNRVKNNKRAWKRICFHLPETLIGDEKLDIIEFSTAHGAMLDIWQSYGHRCIGTDYAGGIGQAGPKPEEPNWFAQVFANTHAHPLAAEVEGWVYQPIIESLGLDVCLFDAGQTPYDFADKSCDVLCCYQAIEAYAHPDDWNRVLDEFCRISRKTVLLGFNPPTVENFFSQDYREAYDRAWEHLRTYNRNGFKNTFFEIGTSVRGIHPVTCKLIYQG